MKTQIPASNTLSPLNPSHAVHKSPSFADNPPGFVLSESGKTEKGRLIAQSPHVASLQRALTAAMDSRPTSYEIARITVAIAQGQDLKEKAPEIAKLAVAVWKASKEALLKDLEDEIALTTEIEGTTDEEFAARKCSIVDFLLKDFPLQFAASLDEIFGKKVRPADQYKRLRDFLRYRFKGQFKQAAKLEDKVESEMARLKADGFSREEFFSLLREFRTWKEELKSEHAKKAARTRWPKKENP